MPTLVATDTAGLNALIETLDGILCNLRDDRLCHSPKFKLLDDLYDQAQACSAAGTIPAAFSLDAEQAAAAADVILNAVEEAGEASLEVRQDHRAVHAVSLLSS